jgi:hypothetical protein
MDWKQYERFKAKEHRGRHVGGPGKADYIRGGVKGEVKHRKTPVTKKELIEMARNGVKEIDSLGGYTGSAMEYADRYRPYLKLFQRGRRR